MPACVLMRVAVNVNLLRGPTASSTIEWSDPIPLAEFDISHHIYEMSVESDVNANIMLVLSFVYFF